MRSFQFVPLRNFLGDRFQNNSQASQAHLAKEVLAEIPSQITLYMKNRGIKPRAPPPAYHSFNFISCVEAEIFTPKCPGNYSSLQY